MGLDTPCDQLKNILFVKNIFCCLSLALSTSLLQAPMTSMGLGLQLELFFMTLPKLNHVVHTVGVCITHQVLTMGQIQGCFVVFARTPLPEFRVGFTTG